MLKALVLEAKWNPRPGYHPDLFETKTRAARQTNQVWKDPSLSVKEVKLREPNPREVVVQVKAAGVCGSDIGLSRVDADGYVSYTGYTRLPCILGHEVSGVVVGVGNEVTALRPGQSVAADNMIWCGMCENCRRGDLNHCRFMEEFGFSVDGAFAEYAVLPGQQCWVIDEILGAVGEEKGYELGALVEPLAVSYYGIFGQAGGFLPGSYVCVIGAGPIGLGAIALTKASGASKVIVLQRSERRRQLAANLGADYVLDPTPMDHKGLVEAVMDITGGHGVDLVVEAAGSLPLLLPDMQRLISPGGKVVALGFSGSQAPLQVTTLLQRSGHLLGSVGHAGRGAFPNVIRLLASGQLDVFGMITRRFPLSSVLDAIQAGAHKREGKVLVKP